MRALSLPRATPPQDLLEQYSHRRAGHPDLSWQSYVKMVRLTDVVATHPEIYSELESKAPLQQQAIRTLVRVFDPRH